MAHTGAVADIVYPLAHALEPAWNRWQRWESERNPVTWERLEPYIRLNPAQCLHTVPSNICNAKCVFCAYPQIRKKGDYRPGVMPFSIFEKVFREYEAAGGRGVIFTPTLGEALTDPGLIEKIELVTRHSRVRSTDLYTNGLLLAKKEWYRRLVDSGLSSLSVSLEGCDRTWYEKVYGVDAYGQVIEGVRMLLEYNRQKGLPVDVTLRFRNAQKPSRISRSPDFRRYIKPHLNARVRYNFKVNFDNWGGIVTAANMEGCMRMKPIMQKVNLPCRGLFANTILHDGSVRLCGCRVKETEHDEMVIGQVQTDSLANIAASAAARQIVRGFYEGVRPRVCEECSLFAPVNQAWLKQRMKDLAGAGPESREK
jgi:sulfatase maturation enzyme AslB (radical SAM superfamily)